MRSLHPAILVLVVSFSLLFSCYINNKDVPFQVYFEKLQSEKVLSESFISWEQFGPGSAGYCEIVKYHPTIPDFVIMSPDMFNNYGSWNNGASWESISDFDGTSIGLRRIRDICFSMQKPVYGLAIDERGWLWKTDDLGHHWERKQNFPANGICSVITFDPANDQTIYVGSGNFWNVKWNTRTIDSPYRGKPIPAEYDKIVCNFNTITAQYFFQNTREPVNPCLFEPSRYSRNDYTMISRTEYGKVWRSSDGGENWHLINNGIPKDADIGKILFHPLNRNVLYMATDHGLFKSENQGDKWINIGTNLPHNMLRDLAVYFDKKINKSVIVVLDQVFWNNDGKGSITSTGGVFKSSDDGKTWELANGNLYLDLTGASEYVTNSYYRALSKWFGISGEEAKVRYPELPAKALQNFNRLVVDPSNTERMYIGHNANHDISFYAGDLWKTENGGKTWIVCNRIGPEWQGNDKEFWEKRDNPTNLNMRFSHLTRWVNEKPYGGSMGCRALTVNSRGDLISVMQQQTLQSKDYGNTWQQIDAVEKEPDSGCWIGTGCCNLTRPGFHMDSRKSQNYFLLCGEHGLWQMCDAGSTSHPPSIKQVVGQSNEVDDPKSISTLAIHPKNDKIMYIQMYRQEHAGYVRKTTDGGKTWENISKPINFSISEPTAGVMTNSLIIAEDIPDLMYFCVPSWDIITDKKQSAGFQDFGIYHSTDGGFNWKRINRGLPAEANVNQLCFEHKNSKILYAAVLKSVDMKTKGGLYRSKDRGETWKPLPIPPEIESVNQLFIDVRNNYIYIACGLSDGLPESGGVWVSRDHGKKWKKIFHMPLVSHVTVAPFDSDRIAVGVGENTNIDNFNPGVYLSLDGGQTWHKSNQRLGQPYWIWDLQFDLTNPDILWCGLWGSGWYKGTIDTRNARFIKSEE